MSCLPTLKFLRSACTASGGINSSKSSEGTTSASKPSRWGASRWGASRWGAFNTPKSKLETNTLAELLQNNPSRGSKDHPFMPGFVAQLDRSCEHTARGDRAEAYMTECCRQIVDAEARLQKAYSTLQGWEKELSMWEEKSGSERDRIETLQYRETGTIAEEWRSVVQSGKNKYKEAQWRYDGWQRVGNALVTHTGRIGTEDARIFRAKQLAKLGTQEG